MKKQGFTLFETVLVVAVLSILIAATYGFILNSIKASAGNRFKASIDSSAVEIINFMVDSLKGAWQAEIEILGSDGEEDLLLGSVVRGEAPYVGNGFRVHLPDLTKEMVPFYSWDKKGFPNGKDDYKNNSYAVSFKFDKDSNGIKLIRHIPTGDTGHDDYEKLVLAGFVEDFKVRVKRRDFMDVELKINYRGNGSMVYPFKYDFYSTFTFSYNMRNKQITDKLEEK